VVQSKAGANMRGSCVGGSPRNNFGLVRERYILIYMLHTYFEYVTVIIAILMYYCGYMIVGVAC